MEEGERDGGVGGRGGLGDKSTSDFRNNYELLLYTVKVPNLEH